MNLVGRFTLHNFKLLKTVACNLLTTWVVLCKSNTQLAYVVVGELCAWFTQYNSSCKQVACDSFRQKLCSVNQPLCIQWKKNLLVCFQTVLKCALEIVKNTYVSPLLKRLYPSKTMLITQILPIIWDLVHLATFNACNFMKYKKLLKYISIYG